MSKLTPAQVEYLKGYVYDRLDHIDTDDEWTSMEREFDFKKDDRAFIEWGWVVMDAEFSIKTWSRNSGGVSDGSFLLDFDYIGIINNPDDYEAGEKSIELHGSECEICNFT